MYAPTLDPSLTGAQFEAIGAIAYDVAGILLPPGKEGLVRSRLARRLRACGTESFGEYLELVRDPAGDELSAMIDALTTNKTDFFRESAHFDYLARNVLPQLGHAPLRIWSAGCSTGEEPYTLAMVLRDAIPDLALRDVRVLATDVSRRVLAHAKAAVYGDAVARQVPDAVRRRHFTRCPDGWQVGTQTRALVTFARLNLMAAWPMRGPFQAIFCRNVMIYFDRATQQRLVERFRALLAPGGHLFVGHAESLTALDHDLTYVQPAVYRR
jgi:chemotaxis protein methyltransferase CheR